MPTTTPDRSPSGRPVARVGVLLDGVGFPLILAASSIVGPETDPLGLVVVGLLVMLAGAALLTRGVLLLAQHADRAAGITYSTVSPPTLAERT